MKNLYSLLRMKSVLAVLCMLCLSILTVSCEEDDPPRISLSTETMNFSFKRDAQAVEVTSNLPWEAAILPASASEWCSLSIEGSSRPSETLKVYVEDNLPYENQTEERHATIVFTTGGRGANPAVTLHVTQGIKPQN